MMRVPLKPVKNVWIACEQACEREGSDAVILDMHVHTAASDDSTATIEGYIELILAYRGQGHTFDGFVLTEHRKFTPGLEL
jgi:hypothetical protein